MKRIALSLFIGLVAASCASGQAPPPKVVHKFAASQTISASYDPSVSGLPGNVGDIVSVAGGATAWVKYGSGITAWQAFPGSGAGGSAIIAKAVATSNITLSGGQSIDGIAVSAGDRVLVTGQSTASQNGLYVVAVGAWTRATDFDAAAEMVPGALFSVYSGSVYAPTIWQHTTTAAITVDTTSLTFAQVSPPTFGSDTTVQMPNVATTKVNALRLQLTLTDNTAGSEDSQWSATTLVNGVATEQVRIVDNVLYAPDTLFFLSDVATGTGFNRAATGQIWVYINGARRAIFQAGSLNLTTTGGLTLGTNQQAGVSLSGSNILVKPETAAGNVELGHVAGALATNATHGFVTLPTAAGTSTGTPSGVTSGQAACIINTSGNKLECYYGAAWHVLSP